MTVIERHKRNHTCNVSLFPTGQTELAKLYHREELSKEIAFGWALCLIQTIGKWENGNLHGRIHGKSFSISIMTFLRFFFIFFSLKSASIPNCLIYKQKPANHKSHIKSIWFCKQSLPTRPRYSNKAWSWHGVVSTLT